jgi:hypothetical protein
MKDKDFAIYKKCILLIVKTFCNSVDKNLK